MINIHRKIFDLISLFSARPAEAGIGSSLAAWAFKKSAKAFTDYAANNTFAGMKEKAKNGDIEAQYNIGLMYHDGNEGENIARNYSEALRWLRMASDSGYAPAQYLLGLMYYNGEGILENYEEAFNLFLKSAHQAYANAQFALGNMYYDGEGVPQDKVEADKWYQKAAEQGYFPSVEWWHRVAVQEGSAEAQNILGVAYLNGDGVEQNFKLAFEWLEKSAAQNHIWGLYNLGVMYFCGYAVQKDVVKASELFHKSVELGNLQQAFKLGDLYDNEACRGVRITEFWSKNDYWDYCMTESYMWYYLAKLCGNSEAQKKLDYSEGKRSWLPFREKEFISESRRVYAREEAQRIYQKATGST